MHLPLAAAASFLRRIGAATEQALNMGAMAGAGAVAQDPDQHGPFQAHLHQPPPHHQPRPPRQRVHNVLLVRARPMYGYYPEERLFVKIVL